MSHAPFYVTVVDSNEVVAVDLTQLPEPDEMLELLLAEAAPLSSWYDCARAYLQAGRIDAFDLIYENATSQDTVTEVEKYFGQKPTYEVIEFHLARAALCIARAREEKTHDAKTKYLADAKKLIAQAGSLDPNEQLVHLTGGMHNMARGDLQQAMRDFRTASQCKNNGKSNVVGFIAVAGLHYQQQQFKEALSYYRMALREFPGAPAEVRLGIAAASLKMGDLECAKAAYKRVLALDPDNADAYLGLALISFNEANVQQGLADGLRHLLTAFELAPRHEGVLALLAHLCMLKGEAAKAEVLAQAVLETADNDALRSEATTLLARAYHAQGRLMEAKAEYVKACALDKKAPIPRLGMAQMYLSAGQLVNAATELEEALKAAPGFHDALKILGQLLPALAPATGAAPGRGGSGPGGGSGPAASGARVAATVAMLKDSTAKQPGDHEMWEMLGELLSATDPAGSLAAYKKALEAHDVAQAEVLRQRAALEAKQAAERKARQERRGARRRARAEANGGGAEGGGLFGSDDEAGGLSGGEDDVPMESPADLLPDHPVPAKLLNNAAVLLHRAGDTAQALLLLQRAVDAMQRDEAHGGIASASHRATLTYNKARLLEACGELKVAEKLYKEVMADHPTYIDCHLRLACMARARGSNKQALALAQAALEQQGGSADALALIAQLHMERRDYEPAGKALTQLLQDSSSKRDVYGRIGFANTYLYTVPRDRREDNAKKAEQRCSKALEEYRAVLDADPRNAWAANGCGAALAELGYLDAAKNIFGEVYGAMAVSSGFLQIPDVLINLANCHLARCEYTDAVHLYRVALEKLEHKHQPQVLLYLARALYDSNKLPEAQACLKRAIHLAPTDYKLRFNFALTLQEWAVRTFRKQRPPGDPTKLPEFQRAEVLLKEAHRHYEHLKVLGRERSGLEEGKLTAHVAFCDAQLAKTHSLVEAAVKEDYEARLKRHEQLKLREAAEAVREAEDLKRRAVEEEVKRKRDEMARAAAEKLEVRKAEWRERRQLLGQLDDDGGGAGGGGGRKRKRSEGGRKRSKGGRGNEPDDLFGDEEEEEPAPQSEEQEYEERGAGPASDEEEGGVGGSEEGEEGGGGAGKGKKKRSRLRAAAAAAPPGDEDLFGDADLEDGDEGAAGGEAGLEDEAGVPSARKRGRRAAALEEDEEEQDVHMAAGDQGGEGEGGGGVDRVPATQLDEEEGGGSHPTHADLFGDDDE